MAMELAVALTIIVLLVALDLAAMRWGVDSRDLMRDMRRR
jgi:hypothetical protein